MKGDTDEILLMNLPDAEKIDALAKLCRRRGKCMNIKDEQLELHKRLYATSEIIIKNLEKMLDLERRMPFMWRIMAAVNTWAKS